MENEFAAMLLTQGGVAIVVALIVKLLVKKPLKVAFKLPVSGSSEVADPLQKRKYSVALNASAVVLGVTLAIVATAILIGLTGENVLSAMLIGLFGAASAVGASEFGSNAAAMKG